MRRGADRCAGADRLQRAGVRHPHVLAGCDRVPDDAPGVWLRACHHRGSATGGAGGPTCYGPNVVAAASLLASQDVIGIQRTADLMSALLGVEVSTGFISSCLVRLDAALTTAEFEDALKAALRAADVLGTDETPAPLTEAATAEDDCHNPHVYTVRTMCAYTGGGPDLVGYGAAGDRTKVSISAFGILDGYHGALVRDDFGGYVSHDTDLAAVQQCLSHLLRYLDDAYAIDPVVQVWARQAADALRTAIHEVNTARAAGATSLNSDLLARLRRSHDQGVTVGISTNTSRGWHKGNHPGLQLARRLKRKAPSVDLRRAVRYPGDKQWVRKCHTWLQIGREGQGLLPDPCHPPKSLPDPVLPGQRPQPRTPAHRRHYRCPHRHALDASHASMINCRIP